MSLNSLIFSAGISMKDNCAGFHKEAERVDIVFCSWENTFLFADVSILKNGYVSINRCALKVNSI